MAAAAAGFRFDFEQFLNMGRIGSLATIELPARPAVWGDVVPISIRSEEPAELTIWRSDGIAQQIRPLRSWRVHGEFQTQWACTEDVLLQLRSGQELLDEAILKVIQPAAEVGAEGLLECTRYAALTLRLRLRYAHEAYLTMPGDPVQPLALQPAQGHTWVEVPWQTDACGAFQAHVLAKGVDSQWHRQIFTLLVRPRPVSHAVQRIGQGRYLVQVRHADPTCLELPLLGTREPLRDDTFELHYHGLQPMLARIHARDDAGIVVPMEVELKHDVTWEELPVMSQQIGWPD